MKRSLRFSTFLFLISPNLAKYTYGWLPLEQHLKIEKKNIVWFFASDGSRRSEFVFQISDVLSFGCIPRGI
jgi:hypothetical protein